MARKRSDDSPAEGPGTATINPPEPAAAPAQEQNGTEPNGKRKPAHKVGTIATGKGESVAACVWENDHSTPDGRSYKVHSIQLELSFYHEGDRQWRPSKSIRPSQLSAVEYCLRQCADFCFRARDPQQDVNF